MKTLHLTETEVLHLEYILSNALEDPTDFFQFDSEEQAEIEAIYSKLVSGELVVDETIED